MFLLYFFFFTHTPTTEIYTLSLHDALPIYGPLFARVEHSPGVPAEETRETGSWVTDGLTFYLQDVSEDRKSTRLNSSHVKISYAVFCLKKKTNIRKPDTRELKSAR